MELVATECTLCVRLRVSFLPHSGQPFGKHAVQENQKKSEENSCNAEEKGQTGAGQLSANASRVAVSCGLLKAQNWISCFHVLKRK